MTENINLKKETDFKSSESSTGENKQWDKDNQAWWDWYVSLADNSNSKTKEVLLELPEPPNIKDASKIDLKQQLSEPYNLTTQDISNFQNYLSLVNSDTVLDAIDKVKDFVGESIPIVDDKGKILGIISESDLFNALLMAEKERNEEELS